MIVVATELLLQEEKNCRGISIYVDILYMYYVYDIYIYIGMHIDIDIGT